MRKPVFKVAEDFEYPVVAAHRRGTVVSPTLNLPHYLFSAAQDVEMPAGRMGHEEDALIAKERGGILGLPDDFPGELVAEAKRKVKAGASKVRGSRPASGEDAGQLLADLCAGDEGLCFGAGLLDDDELDAILQGGKDPKADGAEAAPFDDDVGGLDDGFDL